MILSKPVASPAAVSDEADLVVRARAGDASAREQLARLHRPSAYLLALQLLGNPDDAMDVVQDAMLRFFSSLHRFDVRRPVRPWLSQIVRNRVNDLRRRYRVRRHESLDAVNHDGSPRLELIDPTVDPEDDVEKAQLKVRIWQCLAQLTPIQREILVLRDYNDLTYAEIAQTMDIPMGTVMSRLHGARRKLRGLLQDDLRSILS